MTKIATLHTEYGNWGLHNDLTVHGTINSLALPFIYNIKNENLYVNNDSSKGFKLAHSIYDVLQDTPKFAEDMYERVKSYIRNLDRQERAKAYIRNLDRHETAEAVQRDPNFIYGDLLSENDIVIAKNAVLRITEEKDNYAPYQRNRTYAKITMTDGVEWRVWNYESVKRQFDIRPTPKGD